MTFPNPELCRKYGTSIEKTAADVKQVLTAAAPLLGMGLMQHDADHQTSLEAEAARMNEAARYFEAKKMEGTISALGGGVEKRAEAAGELMAKFAHVDVDELMEKFAAGDDLTEMEKEAIGALLGRLATGAGRAIRSAGKSTGRVGQKLQAGTLQKPATGSVVSPSAASKGPYRTPAAKPAAASTAAAAKPKPLVGGMTKAKLLGAAGIGAAGYAGYKGLQAVRDYMMVPTGQGVRWGHQAPLRHNVSPYGY